MIEVQVDTIRDFLQTNVCDKIKLTRGNNESTESPQQFITPRAFSFQPFYKGQITGIETNAPYVLVYPISGEDAISPRKGDSTATGGVLDGTLIIRLEFRVFEPSEFGGVWDDETERFGGTPDPDGWRSLANFMDRARREIIKAATIGDLEITYPVPYGFFPDAVTAPGYAGWMEPKFRYFRPPILKDEYVRLLS